LLEHHRSDPVFLNRVQAQGDVIFVPDNFLPGLDLSGYRLWKSNRITYLGSSSHSLSIYLSKKLL